MNPTAIAFIGAGNIAETHAAAVRAIPGLTLAAVVDPVASRAQAFARRWDIVHFHDGVEALIAAKLVRAAHVLVPPPLHRAVAEPLLAAGIDVLLEKPMAQDADECAALQNAAARSGAALGINHNQIYHPAHLAARRLIAQNRIGPVRHVQMRFILPLRQLDARQLGHWMFDRPVNLLLEQAVHPLSQIDDLLGPAQAVSVLAAPPLALAAGQEVHRTWLVSLQCARGSAQLHLALGERYPSWGAMIVGDDGAIAADYANNLVSCETPGRWLDLVDGLLKSSRSALALEGQALGGFAGGVLSTLKLRPRSDPFYASMKGSIEAFYRGVERSRAALDGGDGRRLVELCHRIAAGIGDAPRPAAPAQAKTNEPYEILVIGGTGFIGQHLVARLIGAGKRVGVLARGTRHLPLLYEDPRVALIAGDARSAGDVARAIGAARVVVNLAHGGGGGSRAETEANLVGAARTVAEACLARGVARLVYVSSIAAIYLGDPGEIVTGATPVDPRLEERADYARAKALAERAMLDLHRVRGLPVVILRPGVVVGVGGIAFHSGIGFFNHERHYLGWNRGTNKLPLVLADDVADAIVRAADADGVAGRAYNLVGDVRLSAQEYVAALARATGRPLRFHPQSVLKLQGIEMMKALVKRATGRRDPWPSLRDLKSRGLAATFDCSDAARDLGWKPVADRAAFLRLGFTDHVGTG